MITSTEQLREKLGVNLKFSLSYMYVVVSQRVKASTWTVNEYGLPSVVNQIVHMHNRFKISSSIS